MMSRKVPNWLKALILLLLLGVFGCMLFYEKREEERLSKELMALQQEELKKREPNDENSINIVLEGTGYTTPLTGGVDLLLDTEMFMEQYERRSYYVYNAAVKLDLADLELKKDEDTVFLLRFKMRSSDKAAVVNVNFGEKHDFYVSTEWTEYYYPCADNDINYVEWTLKSDFQVIELSDVEIYSYKKSQMDMQTLACGSYLSDAEEKEIIIAEGSGLQFGEMCRDVQYNNGYVYAVGNDSLFIGKEDDNGGLEACGVLRNLGEVRRLEIYDDTMLAVASRHNGVYLIDITDKANPTIISRYYTLEIANDVCFSGNYMFVAGRYFGVEIVDISDIDNPVYVTKISNARECYRVAVQDDTLYISCWARGIVELYDISTINKPKKISEVTVDGRCGEAYVDGEYLYIVTGYSSMSQNDSVGEIGYGTGNGLTIYDISDKSKPKWVSAIKTDGSLFNSGFDDWSICVNNGKAYFTSSYDGLYIYDVSNVAAPKRMCKITVPLYKDDSQAYVDMTASEAYVFPYNCAEVIHSPITGVAISQGKIYISAAYTDIYAIDYDAAKSLILDRELDKDYIIEEATEKNRYKNAEYYLTDQNVYVIEKNDENYYVGTEEGIYILDSNMEIRSVFPTESPVQDIVIQNDYVYTAETSGMGIYIIKNNTLECVSFYESSTKGTNVSSLAITSDENFAIIQASFTEIESVDISNKQYPIRVSKYIDSEGNEISLSEVGGTGSLYYRNIVNGVVNDTIGIIGMGNSVWVKSVESKLQIVRSYQNEFYREEGGSAVLDNGTQLLTVCQNGYKIYDPLSIDENNMLDLTTYKIQDVYISGKATILGNILVVCNAYRGIIWIINIQNLNNPSLIGVYEIDGNPDLCFIEDERILIPVRHEGIMSIELKR